MKSKLLAIGLGGTILLAAGACATTPSPVRTTASVQSIEEITVTDHPDRTEIVVVSEKPMVYTTFRLSDPERLILDMARTSLSKFKQKIDVNKGALTSISSTEGEEPSFVARLEFILAKPVESRARTDGNRLIIEFEKPKEESVEALKPVDPPAPLPGLAPAPIVEEEILPPAKVISKVTAELVQEELKVIIVGDGRLDPQAFMVGKNRLVLDFPSVTSTVRPNTIRTKSILARTVRVGQHLKPTKVRVVVDLSQPVTYEVKAEKETVQLTLKRASEASASPDAAVQPTPLAVPPTALSPAQEEASGVVAVTPPVMPSMKKAPVPAAPRTAVPTKIKPAEEPAKKYVGRRVSLDFQDAELDNVLRLLADVSGLNIVTSQGVKGKVTVKLINVPWDHALEMILKMNGLGQVREGNIIQVDTLTNIAKQQAEEAAAKEAKARAEDLYTRIVPVNYADAELMAESLKKNLSPRGDITIDKRTNTMIVKDIEKNLEKVVELVRTLDSKTPQVLIESRIVQADTSFAQSIGVQWGVGFSDINSGNIYGVQGINRSSGTQPGFGAFAPDFAVNLPATVSNLSAVPSVGFNFGRFTDNPINLDLRLSAGELNGLTKTISSPKITTLDNKEAKIEQGESIPFETTSQQGTQTTFVDASLILQVTPHITADRSIIMKVKVSKNQLGSFSGPAGPSISKREATTEILMKNGETTVIGGIFEDENTSTQAGLPVLSKIPIIGFLFKSDTRSDTKRELLIFLTPRIVDE